MENKNQENKDQVNAKEQAETITKDEAVRITAEHFGLDVLLGRLVEECAEMILVASTYRRKDQLFRNTSTDFLVGAASVSTAIEQVAFLLKKEGEYRATVEDMLRTQLDLIEGQNKLSDGNKEEYSCF